MSTYERQKTKQAETIRFRNRQARVKTIKEKCSFCGAVGSENDPLLEIRGSDDLVYKTCVSCEDQAREFCKSESPEKPFLPRGYYKL